MKIKKKKKKKKLVKFKISEYIFKEFEFETILNLLINGFSIEEIKSQLLWKPQIVDFYINKVKKNRKYNHIKIWKTKLNYRRPHYPDYIKSSEWENIRNRKLKSTNFLCEMCCGIATQVHHIHYKTLGRESNKDLKSVCGACHMDIHKINQ